MVVILEPSLKKEQKDKLLEKFKNWIKKGKGKVTEEVEWGIRSLAYPIDKKKEAFYYFFTLQAEGDLEKILQEQVELESKIMRYLLVRKD